MSDEKKYHHNDTFTPVATSEAGGMLGVRHTETGCRLAAVRPVRDGQSLHSEAVHMQRRADGNYDCITLHKPASQGPAKVTSDAYRTGWDAIFATPDRSLN